VPPVPGPTPWSAHEWDREESLVRLTTLVVFYRRRLPYVSEIGHPIFLTWRLYGSLPFHRPFPAVLSSMVVRAIHYNADILSPLPAEVDARLKEIAKISQGHSN
jgi:hypothetical protein